MKRNTQMNLAIVVCFVFHSSFCT